jgi:hypothetical protein
MSNFKNRVQTIKGEDAECMVVQFLVDQNCTVYRTHASCNDRAHPIDILAMHNEKLKLFAVECKCKARRTLYPDTGIDHRHYGVYSAIQKHNGVDVYLFFIDEYMKKIYGNYLSVLDRKRIIEHNGKKIEYPKIEPRQIYFPLSAMVDIAVIPDEKADFYKSLSRRSYTYERNNGQADLLREEVA